MTGVSTLKDERRAGQLSGHIRILDRIIKTIDHQRDHTPPLPRISPVAQPEHAAERVSNLLPEEQSRKSVDGAKTIESG